MDTDLHEIFLHLVRLGIGTGTVPGERFTVSGPLPVEDWQTLEDLANEQGLLGVMLDGVDKLPREWRPEKKAIIQSIGQLVQMEQMCAVQEDAAAQMAQLLHEHGIRTYVLKGAVVAECYPRPEHRRSVDMDCFLLPEEAGFKFQDSSSNGLPETCNLKPETIWERGNRVLEEQGFEVRRDFYKNSTVVLPGLTVENHRYLTPFRGNERLKSLERLLQGMMAEDAGLDRFDGTWLYRPPVMVSALFLIEHAYSHFLHEGLTWRLVLDWQMFLRRHRDEMDWKELEARVDEFGFRRFYDSFHRLGQYLIGGSLDEPSGNAERKVSSSSQSEAAEPSVRFQDERMLTDIWAPLDVHETVTGLRGKLALAGNTWRARWKYLLFTDMNWLQALWIQAKGVLFEREVGL